MDGFTILVAFIIFIDLLLYMIREVTTGNPPAPPSDEGAPKLESGVPSPLIGAASSSAHENDDKRFPFDAFLSFRGLDIRNRFVSHLYKALKRSNVSAFMDNNDLGKGEPIENLLKHVRESRILLPIFSKSYADSIWCLKEVTEMVEVMKTDQSVDIVPIFFDIEPDDVRCWYRHSQGQFKGGASAGEKKKWRKALRKVTSIHGFTLKHTANGDEAELVDIIVEEVQAKLGKTALPVAKYPIGMEGHVQEVKKLLKKDGQGVNMIALQGMSGIGKTTIAKAVYNELFHDFHGASTFISDVGKKFGKDEGDRSLISLDKQNRFHMHDLLRNMGREIVLRRNQVSPSWKMSRLWSRHDIFDLLQRDEVPSSEVTGIMLNKEVEEGEELGNSVECFRNMHHLRLLHMEGVNFKNNFHYFPKELLWLGLPRCSFESPPLGLNPQKLVILNLSNCNLASLSFFGDMVFDKLKVLDLSSTDLTTTPDFGNFPCLVELILRQCEKLTKVHSSIGKLRSLETLDLRTCTVLEELPDTICNLRSIEVLHLGWCAKLSSLPAQIGNLISLKELSLNDTAIRNVPTSVGQLTSLLELSLQRCNWLEQLPDSLTGWISTGRVKMFGTPLRIVEDEDLSKGVQKLRVSSCKLLAVLPDESCKLVQEFCLTDPTVQEFPHSISRLQNLVILTMKCEQVRSLPLWINGRQLEKLRGLEIESKSLKNIPESIGSLEGLKTLKLVCESLESLPDSIEKLKSLDTFEVATGNLEQLPRWIGSLRSLRNLKVECSSIKGIPESIKQLEELEKLELHVDNPRALSDSAPLPKKLKKFSFSCNDLENLPDCVWSLVELEEFSLRGCGRIEALPDDKLGKLKNLLHLDLSRTGVKTIPKNICCLPKLRSLQITDVGNDTTFWFE
ncbi:putative disease resistance protein [Nymphaea thermarum]|nr:putative disease resistance protein [Nymphaea thermarum]